MFLGRTHDETFVCNTELQIKVSLCVLGLIWVHNVCTKVADCSIYRGIGLYVLCAQQMLMDRNACVIPLIKHKKRPNYATQKSKYRKAFFKL